MNMVKISDKYGKQWRRPNIKGEYGSNPLSPADRHLQQNTERDQWNQQAMTFFV